MDKQDTPITVHLGRGARIQLANTVINTGSTGATIQFGSLDFSAITARTTVPRAHVPAPQTTARDIPQGRTSVFERLSQPETLTAKRVVDGRKISVVTANTTALPRETVTSRKYDAEGYSSGGRLNRRQRRKRNAELRAQQLPVPVHPSNIPAEELQANIPTRNKFTDLKWVKRNSSTGELKQSFWEPRPEVPIPQTRGPERLSARVHRVLKTVKDKGLMKKKFQRPLMIEARRTPPREKLSSAVIAGRREERRQAPREAHRGVTLGPRIQGSAAERAQRKVSRRSAPSNRNRHKWVQKKTHNGAHDDSRHPGESSRGSRHSPTLAKEELNFDRSPRIEEICIPNQEPEIHWRRRSEVQVQEKEYNDEDTMEFEVVYMVSHIDDNDDDDEEDHRSQTREQARRRRRRARSVASQSIRSSEDEEGDEVEGNPFTDETLTLVQIRGQMRRQMKEKDKEISHLNEKMTEMMTQMTAMMEMMQKATSVGPVPAQPVNHAASIAPANPPDPHVPQASGIKGTPEGGNEAVDNTRQRKPKQVYTPSSQPKLVLGGNDKSRAFSGGGERPRQVMGAGDRTFPSLKDKMNKEYSFKRESVAKLFRQALKAGMELPECKRSEESKHSGDPNYCPYHRVISHPIEDCYVFKDWLERKYKKGEFTLSDNVLIHPRKESTRMVTSSSVPPSKEAIKEKSIQGEQWETVVSKKTTKMLKQLEGVPGVKWKSPTEPVLNLKLLPVPHASTSKQQPVQASSSKSDKKKAKSVKKKTKIKKPKEKKTATQRVIDSLGEYHQTARRPIKLGDFMTELKIDEKEEEAYDELFPTETCRVISATPEISGREKYAEEAAPEFCLMVSSMDYSSEEDLYFLKEYDMDPDIASQMEQVNLEDNSESTGESPDATMADSEENTVSNKSESDEVAQVQERTQDRSPRSGPSPFLRSTQTPLPFTASPIRKLPTLAPLVSETARAFLSPEALAEASVSQAFASPLFFRDFANLRQGQACLLLLLPFSSVREHQRHPTSLPLFSVHEASTPPPCCGAGVYSSLLPSPAIRRFWLALADRSSLLRFSCCCSHASRTEEPKTPLSPCSWLCLIPSPSPVRPNPGNPTSKPDLPLLAQLKPPTADAKYFVPKKLKSSSSLEAKASNSKTEKRPKQEGGIRQRGRKMVTPTLPKAAATSKTKRVVPHLGSDTEEDEVIPVKTKNCQPIAKGKKKAEDSDPDYDYESTYANNVQCVLSRRIDSLSVSDSVLVVTRIPLQHFKEVIPREVHNVEELVTFYVRPHKKKGGPGRLFYSVGKLNEEENRDWYRRIIDSGELLPTRLFRFNTKGIRRMLRKQINIPTSKRQLCFCLSIWYGRHPRPLRQKDAAARRGLGFIVQKSDSTSQDVAESLAALSTQQVIRKTVVAEPLFQHMDDEELSNLSSFSLTNSSKLDWSLLDRLRVRILRISGSTSSNQNLQILQQILKAQSED
ncbi:hypothetical protein M5K25_002182 [Dendrobium thyrsiflorum]|uniref:Uncharacterized protein n=1 Tax=Dendrobium thyrsiflorum TaxID=117978 RepID=A0ABD0VRZ6_DENTH